MSNVVKLPGVFRSGAIQVIQDFDHSDFCALLEAGLATNVQRFRGMTILNFPRVAIICTGDNCVSITAPGSSIDYLVREAHEILENGHSRAVGFANS